MLSEWHDAETGAWMDNTLVNTMQDSADRSLLANDKIAYQGGKGNNHLVSIVIPQDTVVAIKVLATMLAVRESAGILPCNKYMFPYSQMSQDHVTGSHAISRVVTRAGLSHPDTFTTTTMRHKTSTMYAQLNLPVQDRDLFYKHMGHSTFLI